MSTPIPWTLRFRPFFVYVTRTAFATLTVSPTGVLLAQVAAPAAPELAVEERVRDRWLHGRQQPRFTPFADSRAWLLVDSLRAGAAGQRRLYVTLGRTVAGRDSGVITFDASGRVARVDAVVRPPTRIPFMGPEDSARYARRRMFDQRGRLSLPESRLWDIVPSFRPASPRAGARWTDTLARRADREGFRQALRGVRVSTIVGDTTIAGRRLWVIRDSARVHYEERWVEDERTLDTLVSLTRTTDGFIRGRHLYDPELALSRARADTTILSGQASLRYPNDYPGTRTFRTLARYERYRRLDLYDRAGYEARQRELRAAAEQSRGGMVIVPTSDIEKRLAAGDTVARDSMLAEWNRSTDPDRREATFRVLRMWGARDERFYRRLDSLRSASGDAAFDHVRLADLAYSGAERPDTGHVRRMIAFMEDPGAAFSLDQSRDALYANLRQALTTWPPAVRDSTRWPCTPAACRLLADQWRAAREPRLRYVGLVALFALDPARWSDTILAYASAGARFLEPAVMLARGVGATWPAASKAPMPPPNADWRTWSEWMNGVDPRYAAERAAAGLLRTEQRSPVRLEESHVAAIRMYQLRTGRDVVSELRRGFDGASSDSAVLVFGTMLRGLGELRLSPDEIAAYFRSAQPGRIALARSAVMGLFVSRTPVADSVTAVSILDRLLALVVEGVPAWRPLDANPAGWARQGPELHSTPTRRRTFLLGDSLPAALREKWSGRTTIVTADEWKRRPLTEGGVLYTLSGVKRVGPFVLVGVNASESRARRPGDAPQHYASEQLYYLMEVNGEWVVVAQGGWVT